MRNFILFCLIGFLSATGVAAQTTNTFYKVNDPLAVVALPSGVYHSFTVENQMDTVVHEYRKDPTTTPLGQAVGCLIVPAKAEDDQMYLRFRAESEVLTVQYVGVLQAPNGDFHTWLYQSECFGDGLICVSIGGGSFAMKNTAGQSWRFDNLLTQIGE